MLKNIGLVCNIDKMYTMKPSQLFYYTCKISSYSLRNDFFLKSDILNSKELNNSQVCNSSLNIFNICLKHVIF